MILISLSVENIYSLSGLVLRPSHLTSCIPAKCSLHFDSSFDTVTNEPALYKLLAFQVLNLMFVFRRFDGFFLQRIHSRPRLL
jgi:hypothetical protein